MADTPKSPSSDSQSLRFDYIKSNLHRVIHVDGLVGGPSPNGHLVLSLFNERAPIPQQVEHAVTIVAQGQAAQMGAEIREHRVSRDSIVREVEVSVVVDYRTAMLMHKWLGEQLERLKSIEDIRRTEPLS